MRCPFCGNVDTQVKDSRPAEDNVAIRRRRFCPACGHETQAAQSGWQRRCPGCGRTTSTTFQELARDIQNWISTSMPEWKKTYPGVEGLNVAVIERATSWAVSPRSVRISPRACSGSIPVF